MALENCDSNNPLANLMCAIIIIVRESYVIKEILDLVMCKCCLMSRRKRGTLELVRYQNEIPSENLRMINEIVAVIRVLWETKVSVPY